ncbi:MAG TPA: J domain-containing protein [Terracidiphilus sp.]|nr:J domain-containing protein [Terracidiphilus sp.]
MSTCSCGKPADTFGGLCGRCAALQTLGLEPYTSPAEIEDAYRTLVKVWHPDRFQNDQKLRRAAEEKLKEINAAHDYLASGAAVEVPRFVTEERESIPKPEEPAAETFVAPESTDEEEPDEVRRVLKHYQRRSSKTVLPRVFFAAGGIAVVAFLWISTDLLLSANPMTQRPWEEFKTELSRDVHASVVRLWGNASDDLHKSQAETAAPPAAPTQGNEPAPVPKATVKTGAETRATTPANAATGAKPYITSGLTPTEVLAILGNPTSSSGEKMFYNGTEIDFRDGRVAAWKIDPKTPIRVKLWPDQALVPGVQAFAIGSPKSDVIALQGTPTHFSDNEFGYGGSIVYFKNDRVAGWKEDPASVRLRVVAK